MRILYDNIGDIIRQSSLFVAFGSGKRRGCCQCRFRCRLQGDADGHLFSAGFGINAGGKKNNHNWRLAF